MSKLSMTLGHEAVVAYKVVLMFQGEVMKDDPKIYVQYSAAFKKCEQLNHLIKSDDYKWKLMCAKGWYDIDPNDKGE
ncbi:hypothetical protein [Lactiplantibacillus plantarum]|uniref:Prophage Lp1 protein 25 n=1 Tax=Lactiplantibacillus plantarum WJL TaxID=1350466 RepID=A0A837P9G2_LACPN|nr:hypothetical protein [Lactiplantibacillus plantarum]ASL37124.1 hypothetical protein CBI37_06560 [Lactiplantibacillus plantarum]ASZ31956.1 hypothetical protein CLC99_01060 [Lactiplantibacillus plantarum]ERO41202.1 hypothetical protein LPLWJ_16210 [Lactiplantibacillus plantarum WJL]KPN44265.1 prophage Lp1 protein 25 [Lactiplantibacillus plantarum WJL]MDO8173931.1 hypothetical protein [Lactiplantibacillus plantarum]